MLFSPNICMCWLFVNLYSYIKIRRKCLRFHSYNYRECDIYSLTHFLWGMFYMYQCPWTSYQIRKITGCACAGNAGNVFPRRWFQRKPLVSDHGMHHGTCVTHVPWCMSGSLTCGDGKNVPGILGACAPAILRIWQEAHALLCVIIDNRYEELSINYSCAECDVLVFDYIFLPPN